MKLKSAILTTAIVVTFSSAAFGQVQVVNTFDSGAVSTLAGPQFAFTYVPVNAGNTIVFGTYIDNGTTGTGVTFNGAPAEAFLHSGRTTLSYLRNAPASVDVVVTLAGNGNTNSGYVIYELSGVAAGEVVLSAGTSITTPAEAAFVISYAGVNNADIAGAAPAAGSIITTSGIANYNSTIGGGGIAHGYGLAGGAGIQALGWTFPAGGGVGIANIAFPTGQIADTDGDGLFDVWEIANFGNLTTARGTENQPSSMGAQWDNDGDGFDNLAEQAAGSDPRDPNSVPGDIDGDGLPDTWEIEQFGNLLQEPDADFDGDDSTNLQEYLAGTLAANASSWPDTDNDGLPDTWELANQLNVGVDDSGVDSDLDGFTNLEEFLAGSDPRDANWTPENAVLAHRWSFSGNLNDSVGGSNAQILNDSGDDESLTSELGQSSVELFGGGKATSDYILLGNNLLSGLQDGGLKPVTIELWATQNAVQNWARIWDFGIDAGGDPGANGSLRMTWSTGNDLNNDQVEWAGNGASWGTNAPYVEGAPFHIVMTIVPAIHSDGAVTRGSVVTWYSAPAGDSQAGGHPLLFRGTFNSNANLGELLDDVCFLGRSMWPDAIAAATYDEVRIWKGALTDTERKLFQLLGPDNINRADADNDGFPDQWEIAYFNDTTTATVGADSDADGETDEVEFFEQSNPNNILSTVDDRDADGLPDIWEFQYFRNLLQNPEDDPDFDDYSNQEELDAGTDPSDPDSTPDADGDGIADGWERFWFGNLTTADSTERPGGVDTNYDGDFDSDLEEFLAGTDPKDEFSGRDTDTDGLPDFWEWTYFQSLGNPGYLIYNGNSDPDGDLANNAAEFAARSNPNDASSFPDLNGDGLADGIFLAATDQAGSSSFNAGTNWTGGLAPVAGSNYMVPTGLIIRTPNTAAITGTFAGNVLGIAGELRLKGDGSTFNANYSFGNTLGTSPILRQAVDAGGLVTLGGTIQIVTDTVIISPDGSNGPLAFAGPVSGGGNLSLSGAATAIRAVSFDNETNPWTGNLTLNGNSSLVVNGTLSPGTGSTYIIAPRTDGVTNSIGGTGTINLAGTLNIDLTTTTPSDGASWNLITTGTVNYAPGFTVAGFTPDQGAVGSRVWTSGDYEFDEITGVLNFTGEVVEGGFAAWAVGAGLTAGVNDGAEDNPDNDGFVNLLEYQLNGDPLGFDAELVTLTEDENHLIFTFERSDISEGDSTLLFLWSPTLDAWNEVVVGAVSSGPDLNGVVVTVTEDGGSSADYDLIVVSLPKSNAVGGKLFGQLEGTLP